ncbi:MAG TPA: outer membrane protein assembly factor BamD [Candidatus Acidoferrum sp.]|nr:outer membrane protein assembly factor BamD [Candidatus Acidoferrum sp.]
MSRQCVRLLLVAAILVAFPFVAPAPLIYRPGEGWTYEPAGGEGKWVQARAKDQLEVAQAAFDKRAYSLALKAARRVVQVWPLSDYAPKAHYLLARCYEAKGMDERAFNEYQTMLEKYPKVANYEEILERQYQITNKYLAGEWFRLWNYVPVPPWISAAMDRTASMYEKVVKNGPYSDVGPQAQMKVGTTRDKQADYPQAVKAYELAADRYNDRPQVAADAIFHAGLSHQKEAQGAEYDQGAAGKAIASFTEFITLYPNDSRVPEAQKIIASLKREQARGSFETAKFYERYRRWNGALVYYNEVLVQDPESPYAAAARQRLDELKRRTQQASK